MSPEDRSAIIPVMEQLLDDPAPAIRCVIGSRGKQRVVVVLQKNEDGEISPAILSKAQIAHINQLAQEHLP